MNAYIKDGTLILEGKLCPTPLPVTQFLIFNSLCVVRLKTTQTHYLNQNVMAFDENAHYLWQIEDVHIPGIHPFTYIGINEDQQLMAYNWDGFQYIVNPKNGKITLPLKKVRSW